MALHEISSTTLIPTVQIVSEIITVIKQSIQLETVTTIKPIQVSSTIRLIEPGIQPVKLVAYDKFNLQLLFDSLIELATFTLNNIEISQMIITDDNLQMTYPINPSMLVEGINVLRIETTNTQGEKNTKVLEINKSLSSNGLVVGSTLFVKGKKYEVTGINGNVVTLNRELERDIRFQSFVEMPTFEVIPKADITFYNQLPAYKSMDIVKAIYHDGMIEEEYELANVLGDVLHTEINLSRNDETKTISIINIERILIPDEV